jgi:hypothetical protein
LVKAGEEAPSFRGKGSESEYLATGFFTGSCVSDREKTSSH